MKSSFLFLSIHLRCSVNNLHNLDLISVLIQASTFAVLPITQSSLPDSRSTEPAIRDCAACHTILPGSPFVYAISYTTLPVRRISAPALIAPDRNRIRNRATVFFCMLLTLALKSGSVNTAPSSFRKTSYFQKIPAQNRSRILCGDSFSLVFLLFTVYNHTSNALHRCLWQT